MNGMNGVAALLVGSVNELPNTDLPNIERKHCYVITELGVRRRTEGLRVHRLYYTEKALRQGDVDTWWSIWHDLLPCGTEFLRIEHYGEPDE